MMMRQPALNVLSYFLVKNEKIYSRLLSAEILPNILSININQKNKQHHEKKSLVEGIKSSGWLNGELTELLGPVVQSIVSLTSSLRVISLTVLANSIYNIMIFFAEKM